MGKTTIHYVHVPLAQRRLDLKILYDECNRADIKNGVHMHPEWFYKDKEEMIKEKEEIEWI